MKMKKINYNQSLSKLIFDIQHLKDQVVKDQSYEAAANLRDIERFIIYTHGPFNQIDTEVRISTAVPSSFQDDYKDWNNSHYDTKLLEEFWKTWGTKHKRNGLIDELLDDD